MPTESTPHVLVVDDDPCMHDLLAPTLAARGIVAHAALTLEEAKRQLATRSFDLLLLDSRLPDGPGEDLLNTSRRGRGETPCIVISAYGREPNRRRELRALGARDVIWKPFLPAELMSRIQSVLNATRITRPLPALTDSRRPKAPTVPEALRVQYEQLRAKYAATLPQKVAALFEAIDRAQHNAAAQQLEEARTLAHRLRGTAGSYGFAKLGLVAGELEDQLQTVIRAETRLADARPEIDLLMGRMRTASLEESAPSSTRNGTTVKAVTAPATIREPDSERTILLVSTDVDFSRQVKEAAGSSLMGSVTFTSPIDAIAYARRAPVAAALLDVDLKSSGSAVDVATRLREVSGSSALPVAFISVDGALSARVAATQAGANLFLTKPLTSHELIDALRQITADRAAEHPRLLLVDDDSDFADWLTTILGSERMDVHVLPEPSRIVESLEIVRPDLLLLDVVLPTVSGLELCRIVRSNPHWQMLPVLIITSLGSQDARLAAFEAGADDYLLKPIVKQELLARIRFRIYHSQLVRERSTRDALTGVLTRRAFIEGFAARLAETDRAEGQLSLCLFDLDHFKKINDIHGHMAGDRVLAALGRALESRFRECDLRGRWGGEEFVVAFPGVDAVGAAEILGRLQRELRETTFIGDKGDTFYATLSGGISTYPADGTSLEDLIRAADARLYTAKRLGRDRLEGPSGGESSGLEFHAVNTPKAGAPTGS